MQITELIDRELIKKGHLQKMPSIFTRVKTYKSMSNKISRKHAEIDDPTKLNERSIAALRVMVSTSKDITPKKFRNDIMKRLADIEHELRKPKEQRKKLEFDEHMKEPLKKSLVDWVAKESLGIRIIAEKTEDCYKIRKVLNEWAEKTGGTIRMEKDFIKEPIHYGYRSIHVLYLFGGIPVDIQIRTWQMQKEINAIDSKRRKQHRTLLRSGATMRKIQKKAG
jgi:ppGpp synthetase/RelA/SpoT-type nucleotidyltranferase